MARPGNYKRIKIMKKLNGQLFQRIEGHLPHNIHKMTRELDDSQILSLLKRDKKLEYQCNEIRKKYYKGQALYL